MIVTSVADNYMALNLERDEILRVLQVLGISAENVCHVSVTLIRWDLTDENRYDKFHKSRDASLDEQAILPLDLDGRGNLRDD